jgi:hypothetical protein
MLGATTIPGYRYMGEARYATLEYYNSGRTRTKTATFVLNLFAKVVSSVVLTKGVDRDELFERYDVKLWSFNDHVVLFALATVPSVAILAGIYASVRGIEAIRSAVL